MTRLAHLIPVVVALLGAGWFLTGCVRVRQRPVSVEELTEWLKPEFERDIRFRSFPGWYEVDPPVRLGLFQSQVRLPQTHHQLQWNESDRRIIYSPRSEPTDRAADVPLGEAVTAPVLVRGPWLVSRGEKPPLLQPVGPTGTDGAARVMWDSPMRSVLTVGNRVFAVAGEDASAGMESGSVVEFVPVQGGWEPRVIAELPQCAYLAADLGDNAILVLTTSMLLRVDLPGSVTPVYGDIGYLDGDHATWCGLAPEGLLVVGLDIYIAFRPGLVVLQHLGNYPRRYKERWILPPELYRTLKRDGWITDGYRYPATLEEHISQVRKQLKEPVPKGFGGGR